MTDTERFERLENDCFILATMLGVCTGRTALAQGSSLFVDAMNDYAARLTEAGFPTDLVKAFIGGANIGMEPSPPDGGGQPLAEPLALGEGLRRNLDALMRKAA